MFFKADVAAGLLAVASAAPQISQISDGQIQAPTGTPVTQNSDGQVQVQAQATDSLSGAAPSGTTPPPSGSPSPTAGIGQYTPLPYDYPQQPSVDSAAVSAIASYAGVPASAIPGATDPVPPIVSSQVTGVTSHGSYSGTPTTTGAVSNSALGTAIPTLPPNPTALVYNPNGTLNDPEPIPYQPAGGLGTNGTEPVYRVQSDFDYMSILLGLYQEWIELDLFHNILATFSEADFTAAGLTPSDRFLIEFMADQEAGHATLLSNLLGGPGGATPQVCFALLSPSIKEFY
jgi:hypothetical protein